MAYNNKNTGPSDEQGSLKSCVRKFLDSLNWMENVKGIPDRKLEQYILGATSMMSIMFNSKIIPGIKVGDVVECNFGRNPGGEVSGAKVTAVVCNLSDSLIYVVPITKASQRIGSKNYLTFKANEGISYYENLYYTEGTLLFDKGKQINIRRVVSIIGSTTHQFMETILKEVARAHTFKVPEEVDEMADVEETEDSKVGKAELLIVSRYKAAFDYIRSSGSENLLSEFLVMVGIYYKTYSPKDQEVLFGAFTAVLAQEYMNKEKKISYKNIVSDAMTIKGIEAPSEHVYESLKKISKKWLERAPELKYEYPQISIIDLLKAYMRNLGANIN